MSDKRVAAIRSDAKVGRGSCSSIDECMTDSELVEALDEAEAMSVADAVKWAYEAEGMRLEAALNCRWGSDDDPELKAYNEFHGKG